MLHRVITVPARSSPALAPSDVITGETPVMTGNIRQDPMRCPIHAPASNGARGTPEVAPVDHAGEEILSASGGDDQALHFTPQIGLKEPVVVPERHTPVRV